MLRQNAWCQTLLWKSYKIYSQLFCSMIWISQTLICFVEEFYSALSITLICQWSAIQKLFSPKLSSKFSLRCQRKGQVMAYCFLIPFCFLLFSILYFWSSNHRAKKSLMAWWMASHNRIQSRLTNLSGKVSSNNLWNLYFRENSKQKQPGRRQIHSLLCHFLNIITGYKIHIYLTPYVCYGPNISANDPDPGSGSKGIDPVFLLYLQR